MVVKAAAATLSSFLHDLADFLPPGIVVFFAAAFIANMAYIKAFRQEMVGTLIMIVCTFSAGKWIGKESLRVAWVSHFGGVVAADYIGGGPQVNPAVTCSMFTLGKICYTEAYVRIAGQMMGGLIAFPLFHALSNHFGWEPFGGPEYNMDSGKHADAEAFVSEFGATFLLCLLVYAVNWEMNFGTYHYWIKQSLTAIGIRALIEFFPTAGPAMNPMLATSWAVFGVGATFEYPKEPAHYIVYWVAPFLAAILASITYVIYAGGTIYGKTLPVGPIKKPKVKANKKTN